MDLEFDKQHIWHPYSSATRPATMYPIVSAKGSRLKLEDGRELIDGMSSWWCVIHGYNHPVLNQAIKDQVDGMAHVMFGGLTHEPAIELCKKLVQLSPEPLQRVFLCDAGSVAVEVAIKMSLQYWQAKQKKEKHRLLSLRRGYHGDTFAAMSVCDPDTGMHHIFNDVLMPNYFSEAPSCGFHDDWHDEYITDFKHMISKHQHELAAVILEPIVQGAGGMRFYSPEFLKQVRKLCDEYDVLLIADEIATGFGRTGELFACEHANISPDIMCLGKSITGGYMTLAATLCTDNIANSISEGEAGVFMHGPTFMANPLACSVANASIEVLLNSEWQNNIRAIEKQLEHELSPARELNSVANVRVLGAIGVIEMKEAVDMKVIQDMFVQAGIWIRPFGKLVYTMPAFNIESRELSTLCQKMLSVITEYSQT